MFSEICFEAICCITLPYNSLKKHIINYDKKIRTA